MLRWLNQVDYRYQPPLELRGRIDTITDHNVLEKYLNIIQDNGAGYNLVHEKLAGLLPKDKAA